MRIGNKEAERKAIALATAFLATKDHRGFDWKCVGASPDLLQPDNKDRKTYVKWAVSVDYSMNGNFVDGPGIVLVDLRSEQCTMIESP